MESRRNSSPDFPGIPGRCRADSTGIPLESAGIIAGIPPVFPWNSGHFQLEFRRIIAGIPPVFKWNSSRNSTGIIAGIPPVFHWNSSRNSAGIIAGIPLVFHWNSSRNSAGIIAGIPPVFHWNSSRNSAGIIAGIPLVFHWNSSRNSAGIIAGIPLELLPAYRWYSGQLQLEFHRNSWPEYCWNSRIRIEFWLGKYYCQHIARILDFFTQHWFRIHTYKLNIHAYKLYLYTVTSHSNQILCWLPSIELGTPVSVKYQQTKWYKTWTADYWLGIKHRVGV